MFCQSCGAQIPDGSTFCASCGSAQAQQAAPQQAAPQQPYQAPQQPYMAPQQPYMAPQAPAGGDFMHSLQLHNILKQFGFFVLAALFVLFGILMFTGCQYGSTYGYSLSQGIYETNGFCCFMDIIYGIVLLAGGLAQVFFWAQFNNNNLGFLPMLGAQKSLKLLGLVNLVLAAASAVYFVLQGILIATIPYGGLLGLSFFSPWMGLVMLLVTGAYFALTKMYYKNVGNQIQ